MKRLCSLLLCSILVGTSGCSPDPRNVRITEANEEKVLEEVKDMKGLTVDDSRLLMAAFMRREFKGAFAGTKHSFAGKTIGDVIAEEKAFQESESIREAETKRLAEEARAKEEAMAVELRKAISLTVYSKTFRESDPSAGSYSDYIVIKCAYENTSGKNIRAFKGVVKFTDLFGADIFSSGLTISDPIKAGEKATWTGTIDFNQFMDEHRRLKNASLNDMKVLWLPSSIIFEDGSQLGKTE